MRLQKMAHYLLLAFTLILVYCQHKVQCLINEIVNFTNLVVLINCFN